MDNNGILLSSLDKNGIKITYSYDPLGRKIGITDPRTGTTITPYNLKGRVDYIEDAASNRTIYSYDTVTGRKIGEKGPIDNITRYAYNMQNQLTHSWGSAAYPVKYLLLFFSGISFEYHFDAEDPVVLRCFFLEIHLGKMI